MRGAHGIAVDAARRDLVAPAAFDGVVNADHDPSGGQEPVEDHQQQFAADGGAVPSRSAEHVVVAREVAGFAEANDTQSGAHRALSRGERHAGDERQHMVPDRRGENAPEGRHQRGNDRRHHRRRGERGRGAMSGHRDGRIESRQMRLDAFQAQAAAF